MQKFYIYFRDMFRADWVSWSIAVWFCYGLYCCYFQKRDDNSNDNGNSDGIFRQSTPLVVFGLLFVFYAALLSVQPVWRNIFADFAITSPRCRFYW